MTASLRGIGMTSQRTRDRLARRLAQAGIRHPGLLRVVRQTPRHIFVDEALASRAYDDTALPIGYGQTISQPYMVARMTEALLAGGPLQTVLEIGTGSGYQTAIVAQLAERVYSIERIEPLIAQARARFQALGLHNIRLRHGDGSLGWLYHGPYQGILVTAAPSDVPQDLLDQLAIGGRLVIPVGDPGCQRLLVIKRTLEGYEKRFLELVSFVPLLADVD